MLMLCRKTRATNEGSLYGRNDQMVSSLLSQLRQGLEKVVGALENYSLSFEALSGMRGKYSFPLQLPVIDCSLGSNGREIADRPSRSNQRGRGCRFA